MPFIFVIMIMFFAPMLAPPSNSVFGRLALAGQQLGHLDIDDFFGDFGKFPRLETMDSGYTYVINRFGLVGCVGVWALFSASTPQTREAMRFKTLIAIYVCLALSIGSSVLSIKTAALLWFLYGVSQSRRSAEYEQRTFEQPGTLSPAGAM